MPTQQQIRADLTRKFVEALKQGICPWRKPWRDIPDPARLPTNLITKRQYQGVNVPLLWLAQQEKRFPTGFWASFQQWRAAGAHVRKGEKGTAIVFWRQVTKAATDKDGNEKQETFPILRTWSVFNAAQVEGKVAEPYQTMTTSTSRADWGVDRTEFDQAVAATKADIRFGGNQAVYYRPPGDRIVVPNEDQFLSFPAYAETVLHELCHWTEWRTGWAGGYAEGELRAEIGACFLASSLGIPNSDDLPNHAAYIQSWLRALEGDPKFIFRASAAASKAADYILAFSRTSEGTTPEAADAPVKAVHS